MKSRTLVVIILTVVVSVAVVVWLTLSLTPERTNPAFAVATGFTNAAAGGDDEAANAFMSDDLRAYVEANCPDGSVSACIDAYAPPEWGDFLNAVYRRSAPDGTDAWDVRIVATYEEEDGFSGVCIHNRVEQNAAGAWQVVAWAGFVPCGTPQSVDLTRPDAPNRTP